MIASFHSQVSFSGSILCSARYIIVFTGITVVYRVSTRPAWSPSYSLIARQTPSFWVYRHTLLEFKSSDCKITSFVTSEAPDTCHFNGPTQRSSLRPSNSLNRSIIPAATSISLLESHSFFLCLSLDHSTVLPLIAHSIVTVLPLRWGLPA
jgi:hypothetical protein